MSYPKPPPQQPHYQYQPPMHTAKKKMGCLQLGFVGIAGFCMLGVFASIVGGGSRSDIENSRSARTSSDNAVSGKSTTSAKEEEARQKAEWDKRKKNAIKVSAEDLWRAYDSNTVSADEKYKDKLVLVSGEVTGVTEMFGKFQVNMASDEFRLKTVQISYPEESREAIKKISKGDGYSIYAIVKEERLGVVLCDAEF